MRFVLRMLISAAAMFAVAYVSEGALLEPMEFWPTAVIAAIVLALANAFVKPVVSVLALPVTILSLGLFSLVINAGMLYLVDWVVPSFETVSFLRTVLASIILAIVNGIASKLLEQKQ